MHKLISLAALAAFTWVTPVQAKVGVPRQAICVLQVGNQIVINGPCDFTPLDVDGSFIVGTRDDAYFAYVMVSSKGVADGYWNETKFASHAHTPLGTLIRHGACWTNDEARVCAY